MASPELRGIADNAYRALQHREAYTSGAAIGPRLFTTAEAVDGERVYYPMMIPTTSEAQLHREFDRLKALDFDFVKLYVRLPLRLGRAGHQLRAQPDGCRNRLALSAARSRSRRRRHVAPLRHRAHRLGLLPLAHRQELLRCDNAAPRIRHVDDLHPAQAQCTPKTHRWPTILASVSPPWENARLKPGLHNDHKIDQATSINNPKTKKQTISEVVNARAHPCRNRLSSRPPEHFAAPESSRPGQIRPSPMAGP